MSAEKKDSKSQKNGSFPELQEICEEMETILENRKRRLNKVSDKQPKSLKGEIKNLQNNLSQVKYDKDKLTAMEERFSEVVRIFPLPESPVKREKDVLADKKEISEEKLQEKIDVVGVIICPVTYEEYGAGNLPRSLPSCGHIFGQKAISQGIASCPLCRAPFFAGQQRINQEFSGLVDRYQKIKSELKGAKENLEKLQGLLDLQAQKEQLQEQLYQAQYEKEKLAQMEKQFSGILKTFPLNPKQEKKASHADKKDSKAVVIEAGQDEFEEGIKKYNLGQYQLALEHFIRAAEDGYPPAYLYLGLMHDRRGGFLDDPEKAAWYYKKAGERSYWFKNIDFSSAPRKIFYAGLCCEFVGGDEFTAFCLYLEAARRGDAQAQRQLGIFYLTKYYLNAKSGHKYDIEALKWFKKSAEQGNASAAYHAGMLHLGGEGGLTDTSVELSDAKALSYFRQAATEGAVKEKIHQEPEVSTGHVRAKYLVGAVPSDMKPESVVEQIKFLQSFVYIPRPHFFMPIVKEYGLYSRTLKISEIERELNYRQMTDPNSRQTTILESQLRGRSDQPDALARVLQEGCLETLRQDAIERLYRLGCVSLDLAPADKQLWQVDRIKEDLHEALIVAKQAGHSGAVLALGLCWYLGRNNRKNYKNALSRFEKAVAQGHEEAQSLAKLVREKIHSESTVKKESKADMEQVDEEQVDEDMELLIDVLLKGIKKAGSSEEFGKKILRRMGTAKDLNMPPERFNIGQELIMGLVKKTPLEEGLEAYYSGNLEKALRGLKIVSEERNPAAYLYLYRIYICLKDKSRAQTYQQKVLAAQGWFHGGSTNNPEKQLYLGMFCEDHENFGYQNPDGSRSNEFNQVFSDVVHEKARQCYRSAAAGGNVWAQIHYSDFCERRSFPGSRAIALLWCEEAATQKNIKAISELRKKILSGLEDSKPLPQGGDRRRPEEAPMFRGPLFSSHQTIFNTSSDHPSSSGGSDKFSQSSLQVGPRKAPLSSHQTTFSASSDQFNATNNSGDVVATSQGVADKKNTGEDPFKRGVEAFGLQDYAVAREYFERAAAMEYPPAFIFLGVIYYRGYGIKEDSVKAEQYFKQAKNYWDWFSDLNVKHSREVYIAFYLHEVRREYKYASERYAVFLKHAQEREMKNFIRYQEALCYRAMGDHRKATVCLEWVAKICYAPARCLLGLWKCEIWDKKGIELLNSSRVFGHKGAEQALRKFEWLKTDKSEVKINCSSLDFSAVEEGQVSSRESERAEEKESKSALERSDSQPKPSPGKRKNKRSGNRASISTDSKPLNNKDQFRGEKEFDEGLLAFASEKYEKALSSFERAAAADYLPAYIFLWRLYKKGYGVDENSRQSKKAHCRNKLENYHGWCNGERIKPRKELYLAFYFHYMFDENDWEQTVKYYENFAGSGQEGWLKQYAQHQAGFCHFKMKNIQKAKNWFTAAINRGFAPAQHWVGRKKYDVGDNEGAIPLLEKTVNSGYADDEEPLAMALSAVEAEKREAEALEKAKQQKKFAEQQKQLEIQKQLAEQQQQQAEMQKQLEVLKQTQALNEATLLKQAGILEQIPSKPDEQKETASTSTSSQVPAGSNDGVNPSSFFSSSSPPSIPPALQIESVGSVMSLPAEKPHAEAQEEIPPKSDEQKETASTSTSSQVPAGGNDSVNPSSFFSSSSPFSIPPALQTESVGSVINPPAEELQAGTQEQNRPKPDGKEKAASTSSQALVGGELSSSSPSSSIGSSGLKVDPVSTDASLGSQTREVNSLPSNGRG